MTPDEYCRALEAHLTRKNDGHLIRIVGPAFEMVRGWAERGIPYKIAAHGVDRAFERYHARGQRRRPLRVEYAEADVLDAFDQWRRAVGIGQPAGEDLLSRRRESLAAHITRAAARLSALRAAAGAGAGRELRLADDVLDEVERALEQVAAAAPHARGDARARIVADLGTLDRRLIDAAHAAAGEAVLAELDVQAAEQLRPFRDRMPADAWRQARRTARDRLLRVLADLPALVPE